MLIYYHLLRVSTAVISDFQYCCSSDNMLLLKESVLFMCLGLKNKVPDLLLQCQNVSLVALRNVAVWPLTQKLSLGSLSLAFPPLQLLLASQRACIHFHYVLLNSSEAGLCAAEKITERQNRDKLDGGHGKAAVMGDFALHTVRPEAIFTCHFIMRVCSVHLDLTRLILLSCRHSSRGDVSHPHLERERRWSQKCQSKQSAFLSRLSATPAGTKAVPLWDWRFERFPLSGHYCCSQTDFLPFLCGEM